MKQIIANFLIMFLVFNSLFAQNSDDKKILKLTSGKHEISLTAFKEKEICVYNNDANYFLNEAKIHFYIKKKNNQLITKEGKTYSFGKIVNLKLHDLSFYFVPTYDTLGNEIPKRQYDSTTKQYDLGEVIESLKIGDQIEFYDIKLMDIETNNLISVPNVIFTLK
jgi:hypothetical protein